MSTTRPVQLLDEVEVSRRTGRALSTLRNDRHVRRGLPYVRLGRSIRYIEEDVESYILERRIQTEG